MTGGYPILNQRGGPAYPGIEQPPAVQALSRFDPATDPGGLALKARARQAHDTYANTLREGPQDQWTTMHLIQNSQNANSPMDPWFQALQEAGVDKIRAGASPSGSQQLQGTSVQPGSAQLTTYGSPAGMTPDATRQAASTFASSGALPDWYQNATPSTQSGFGNQVTQALKGLRRQGNQ